MRLIDIETGHSLEFTIMYRQFGSCSGQSVDAWMYLILSSSDRVLRSLLRPKYPVGLAVRSLRAPSIESRQ